MKYIKEFENNDISSPDIGDYVVCVVSEQELDVFKDFLSKNIGRIKFKDRETKTEFQYVVKFKNPESIADYISSDDKNCVNISRDEIKFWSSNKEDCEIYLSAMKYNL